MKIRYILPVLLLSSLMIVSSCGKKEKKDVDVTSVLKAPDMNFDREDTLEINRLVDEFVASMANHNIDSCMRMLFKVRHDSVLPLESKDQREFKDAWSKLHIYGVKKKSVIMRSNRNNDVKIIVQIIGSGDLDKEIGVTSFHLNPVYKEGRWYLTLLSEKGEGVYNVYDESENSNRPSNVGVVN